MQQGQVPKGRNIFMIHIWTSVDGAEIRLQIVCLEFFPLLYYAHATSKFGMCI